MRSIVYVGMDVHKDTFSLCALDGETAEILGETKCASDPRLVEKFVGHLAEECPLDTEFLAGYEAGCLGYSLYKSLNHLNINCVIMAPTTMFSSTKNKVVKNDTADAKMIARNLASHTYRDVYVPDEEDDDVKEYIRMRKAFKKELTRAKQHLNALILRRGYQYNATKTKWTEAHRNWIKHLSASSLIRDVVDQYMIELEELEVKVANFDRKIEELSHSERYVEPVKKLTGFKGISTTTAMTIQVELSSFDRFAKAPALMSYLGLTPSEHSSGNHTSLGAITKQGNSAVRTALVEAAQGLVKGHVGHKTKAVMARQVGLDAAVIHYIDKGTIRLQRKFQRMRDTGKAYNVAIAAVARELAGYIWGVETGNIDY